MTFKPLEVYVYIIREIDADRVRIQRRCAVDRVAHFSDLHPAMTYLFYLIGMVDDALGKKKTRREFSVITGCPHRDRYRSVRAVRKAETYLERFLDRENVGRIFRRSSGNTADRNW